MSRSLLAMAAAVAVLLVASQASADARLPGNRFVEVSHDFFLTGESGSPNGQDSVLLLAPEAPAAQGTYTFLVPGLSILGILDQPSSQSWSTDLSWEKDLEGTTDATARLYFVADVQAVAIFEVRLYDVAPDGMLSLVDSNQQQFITALSPTAVEFPLHTTGVQVHKDHVLRVEVFAQTLTVAVLLQYGGETASSVDGLTTRWLDSDADGVPDSDEEALGRNPLNPNDPLEVVDEGADTDGDGLADRTEDTLGTDPDLVDTDGDGFGDGLEVHAGSDPLDPLSKPYDVNNNGLPDSFETNYFSSTTVIESDGPCAAGPGCVDPAADPDGDGCTNHCEASNGTDPNDADSDDDGVGDGDELDDETDPASASSVYRSNGVPEPVASAAFFAVGSSLVLLTLLRRPFP
jgi:hypothetical protein